MKEIKEMIGSNINEMLDAINRLNGAQMSGNAFKHRDFIKLNPVDNTGHIINKNKFSVEVIPTQLKSNNIDTNTYLKDANAFLEKNGIDCKLYKIK
jgi:hypothetical protein